MKWLLTNPSCRLESAVYFCDPSSPWQRGSNENTNGLLRQSFPKGKGVVMYTQDQLDKIANKSNARPRKPPRQ